MDFILTRANDVWLGTTILHLNRPREVVAIRAVVYGLLFELSGEGSSAIFAAGDDVGVMAPAEVAALS